MTPEVVVYAQRLTLVEDLRELTGLRVGDDVQVLDRAGASCWLTACTVARLLWPSDGTAPELPPVLSDLSGTAEVLTGPAPEAGERRA